MQSRSVPDLIMPFNAKRLAKPFHTADILSVQIISLGTNLFKIIKKKIKKNNLRQQVQINLTQTTCSKWSWVFALITSRLCIRCLKRWLKSFLPRFPRDQSLSEDRCNSTNQDRKPFKVKVRKWLSVQGYYA